MNRRLRDYLILFSSIFIVYLTVFLRNINIPFLGNDSYYFLNYIFYDVPLHVSGHVQEVLFGLFPANIFFIKIIMFFTTLSIVFIFYETIRLIHNNRALIPSILLLCTFWFGWIFIKLEDDLFGFLFVVISLYFLIRYLFKDKCNNKLFNINIILSLIFLLIGVLIWNFAIYFLFAFLILSRFHKLYVIGSLVSLYFIKNLFFGILPNLHVSENFPIKAIIVLSFFFFFYKKEYRNKQIYPAILTFSIISLINLKFIYILIPILLINYAFVDINKSEAIKKYTYGVIFMFLIMLCYQNFITYPTNNDYGLFSIAQTTSIELNKELYFDWNVGYFAIYHGFDAKHFGNPNMKLDSYENLVVLTSKSDPKIKNCKEIEKSKFLVLASC